MFVRNRACLARMATRGSASFRRDPQITRIHKFDVLRAFLQPFRESSLRHSSAILEKCIARLHVRFFFCRNVFKRS